MWKTFESLLAGRLEAAPCNGDHALSRRAAFGRGDDRQEAREQGRADPSLSRCSRAARRGAKLLTLPILPPLRAILDASELGSETWLETSLRQALRRCGLRQCLQGLVRGAGLPQCSPHGLRKIGAVRAAEAGASEHELMAMFGWDDADMARVYTRKAAQKKMAASGAAKVSKQRAKIVPNLLVRHLAKKPMQKQRFRRPLALPRGVEPLFQD